MNNPCCPIIGRNIKGFALTTDGEFALTIEYIDPLGQFFFCRSTQNKIYRIYRTDFKPMPTIPSRLREYVFTDLAPFWAEALNKWPEPIYIDPTPRSNESLAKKIRDSREAKTIYGWKHPSVDEAKWTEFAHQIAVSLEDSFVIMGPRGSKRKHGSKPFGTVKKDIITIIPTPLAQLEELCSLLHHRLMKPQPTFLVSVDPSLVADFENRYDIAFLPTDKPNEYLL